MTPRGLPVLALLLVVVTASGVLLFVGGMNLGGSLILLAIWLAVAYQEMHR